LVVTGIRNQVRGKLRWAYDALLHQMLRHTGVLFAANVLSAVLGVGALALAARGLGADGLGILVMIVTYVTVIDQFVNFQAWQAVIKFGADALEKKLHGDFGLLVRAGFYLEVVTALVGTILAVLVLVVVSQFAHWGGEITILAIGYSLSILFRVTGTPTAVLRLFDRFGLVAAQVVIAAAIKLVGVSVGFVFDASLVAYVCIWALSDILGRLLLIAFSMIELGNRGFRGILKGGIKGVSQRFPDIWSVVWTVNLSDTVRVATRELDTLLIGLMLGPASTALYKIAKQVSDIPGKFANPLQQVLYPYLARLWSRGEVVAFNRYGTVVSLAMASAGVLFLILFAVAGERILILLFGGEFAAASDTLIIMLIAYCVFYLGIHLRPKALILGLHRAILVIYVVATVLFYAGYFSLISAYGISGAATAHVVYFVTWYVLMEITIRRRSSAALPGGD
jgi:O-antigen/teichoic acid export membrane protein